MGKHELDASSQLFLFQIWTLETSTFGISPLKMHQTYDKVPAVAADTEERIACYAQDKQH